MGHDALQLRLTVEQVVALEEHPLGWRLIEDEDTGRLRIVDADGDDIIYVGDNGRWEAQAPELIAAAPELRVDWLAMHARIAALEAEAAQLREELDERLPVLRRSLDLVNELHSAASAALTAAGHPHVDGRTLAERVEALAADRDRRIEPVEHARAEFKAWIAGSGDGHSPDAMSEWLRSRKRANLVARVGLAVVTEVE